MRSWFSPLHTPCPLVGLRGRWGATDDEILKNKYGSPKQKKQKTKKKKQKQKKNKRDQLDADPDNAKTTSHFPRFLLIESTATDHLLSKLSPFVIEKVLVSVAGSPKSVKKLISGALLVEVEKPKHAENLLKISIFFQIPAKCSPHTSLNTSRGIIRCPDLAGVSEEEIVQELAKQNVTGARRITVYRDIKREMNTIVLIQSTQTSHGLMMIAERL